MARVKEVTIAIHFLTSDLECTLQRQIVAYWLPTMESPERN